MKISDKAVALLRLSALRKLTRNIHPEDATVYQEGLEDGATTLSKHLLTEISEDKVIEEDIHLLDKEPDA